MSAVSNFKFLLNSVITANTDQLYNPTILTSLPNKIRFDYIQKEFPLILSPIFSIIAQFVHYCTIIRKKKYGSCLTHVPRTEFCSNSFCHTPSQTYNSYKEELKNISFLKHKSYLLPLRISKWPPTILIITDIQNLKLFHFKIDISLTYSKFKIQHSILISFTLL